MSRINYNIKPKQTVYNNILFRSRLEAKWACMFDKLGWSYQYEPAEINGYNPDFILYVTSKNYNTKTIIVEVKPSVYIDDEYIIETIKKYNNIPSHILILDDNPFTTGNEYKWYCRIGYGSQYLKECVFEKDEFYMKSLNDISSYQMAWDSMIFNDVKRKQFLTFETDLEYILELQVMWIECGNEL